MSKFLKIAALASILLPPAGMAFAAERTVTLDVDNMTCVTCPLVVRSALTAVLGVDRTQVSFRARTATVTFDDARTTVEVLTQATTQAGFPARVRLAARGS
jgi:mercuric ion binding protein